MTENDKELQGFRCALQFLIDGAYADGMGQTYESLEKVYREIGAYYFDIDYEKEEENKKVKIPERIDTKIADLHKTPVRLVVTMSYEEWDRMQAALEERFLINRLKLLIQSALRDARQAAGLEPGTQDMGSADTEDK